MGVKRGLGKGLDSMIPEKIQVGNKENLNDVSRETYISISEIQPNELQPRKMFIEDTLQELAESIKQYGIIQPLIVCKKNKSYEIIAGERRFRAAQIAGLKEVPVIIKEYTPQEVMEIALVENIQREDLNPIEEATAYQNLMTEFYLKQDEVAERVGKSRSAVTNIMRLLKLDPRVQQMLIDEMISVGHARPLITIENLDIQHEIAMKVFDQKLSVRETEKYIKKYMNALGKEEVAATVEKNPHSLVYRALEDKIREIVGTKVTIQKKAKNKGKIEIEYYSDEELERLVELFETIK